MSGRKRYDDGGRIALNGHELLPKDLELLGYVAATESALFDHLLTITP